MLSLAQYSFGQQTITPGSLQIQIPQKPIPVSIDHKHKLVYEAHITNTSTLRLEITGFSILTLTNKDTVLHYDQTALKSRLYHSERAISQQMAMEPSYTPQLHISYTSRQIQVVVSSRLFFTAYVSK